MSIFTKLGVNVAAPFDAGGSPRQISPQDFQIWMSEVERLIKGLLGSAGNVELPDLIYRYIITGGNENKIVATPNATPPSAAGEALFTIEITRPNTGNVTINGRALLTSAGNQIIAGGLVPGIWLFLDDGSNFRLVSDQSSQAIMDAAEQAANSAQEARDIVENLASDIVSQGNVPIYASLSSISQIEVPAGVTAIRVNGRYSAGDGEDGLYTTVNSGSRDSQMSGGATARRWYRVPDIPTTLYGKIVIAGSSTAAGNGTSTYTGGFQWPNQEGAKSWVGLLRARLGDAANIINVSVGGTNTRDTLNEFHSKIAFHKPNFVIFCTGWYNEAGSNDWVRVSNYINNHIELCRLARAIGAIPIVIPLSANSRPTTLGQLDVAAALGRHGIPTIDFMSLVSKSDGTFLAGLSADGIHGNDTAHQAYANSVFMGMFNLASAENPIIHPLPQTLKGHKSLLIKESAEARAPIQLWSGSFDWAPSSWAAYAKVQATKKTGNQQGSVLTAQTSGGGNSVRIRASVLSPTYQLIDSAGVVLLESDVRWNRPHIADHCLSYSEITRELTWWINGKKVGATTAWDSVNQVDYILVGGRRLSDPNNRLVGWYIHDCGWWSAPIFNVSGNVQRVINGEPVTQSLIARPVLDVSPIYSAPNQVNNAASLAVEAVELIDAPETNDIIQLQKTDTQSIASGAGTYTIIKFNEIALDGLDKYDPITGEINLEPGIYHVTAAVRYEASASPQRGWCSIYVYVGDISQAGSSGMDVAEAGSSRTSCAISTIIHVTEVTKVSIRTSHLLGTVAPIGGAALWTWCNILKL